LRNYQIIRAVTLGTGLTALFLLVRCSVPGRDYSPLGIGQSAGSGGESGSGDDIVLHSSGGQGGLGDAGSDQGGAAGAAGAPPEPIPCNAVSTPAGTTDAGTSDAGTDAGATDGGADDAGTDGTGADDTACACVDGFIRSVDADGDGDGTRACSSAPGLDCDDSDPAVTHNSCGGCTVLPNAIGEDCGDCGTYACDGPDGVKCVSKPDPLVDPDCRCVAGLIVARDTDGDGTGTRLCEQNPGTDCNDGNASVISNECGGCADLPGAVGDTCNECGAYVCYGGTLKCGPSPTAVSSCTDNMHRQSCNANGYWSNDPCEFWCARGECQPCTPGTFQCAYGATGDTIYGCFDSTSYGINWWYWDSCVVPGSLRCDPTTGGCKSGSLLLPRDRSFDLVPSQRDGLPWHELLNTALDSEYG
jgi:hypothetical protein